MKPVSEALRRFDEVRARATAAFAEDVRVATLLASRTPPRCYVRRDAESWWCFRSEEGMDGRPILDRSTHLPRMTTLEEAVANERVVRANEDLGPLCDQTLTEAWRSARELSEARQELVDSLPRDYVEIARVVARYEEETP